MQGTTTNPLFSIKSPSKENNTSFMLTESPKSKEVWPTLIEEQLREWKNSSGSDGTVAYERLVEAYQKKLTKLDFSHLDISCLPNLCFLDTVEEIDLSGCNNLVRIIPFSESGTPIKTWSQCVSDLGKSIGNGIGIIVGFFIGFATALDVLKNYGITKNDNGPGLAFFISSGVTGAIMGGGIFTNRNGIGGYIGGKIGENLGWIIDKTFDYCWYPSLNALNLLEHLPKNLKKLTAKDISFDILQNIPNNLDELILENCQRFKKWPQNVSIPPKKIILDECSSLTYIHPEVEKNSLIYGYPIPRSELAIVVKQQAISFKDACDLLPDLKNGFKCPISHADEDDPPRKVVLLRTIKNGPHVPVDADALITLIEKNGNLHPITRNEMTNDDIIAVLAH